MIQIVRSFCCRIFDQLNLRLGIQFLVKIATDLGLPERETYEADLKRVNKMKEVQRQVIDLTIQ